ncbi:MAG TPA: peptidylprolyl isomerase [Thermoanaerobaculia bacterium]|nr:peptidylprolyl isomerase [Thermoanaerobaculia bacterium]
MKKDLLAAAAAIAIVFGVCYWLASVRPAQPVSPAAARSRAGGEVILRVNGEPITARDFNLFLSQLPEQTQAIYASGEGRRELADQIIKLKVLEQEGRRLGGERDPEIASRVSFGKSNLLAGYALQKIAKPDDAKLRAAYEKERKNLETIELSHILLAYEGGQAKARDGSDGPPAEVAIQRARSIAAEAAKGTSFRELAARHSEDASTAMAGGTLGAVPIAALPPEIAAAVTRLPPGAISEPVKSGFGIHIFRVGNRGTQSFEQMREALLREVQKQTMTEAIDRLQKSAVVKFDEKFFGPAKKSKS